MVDIKSVLRLVRDGIETYAPDYMHGLPKRDYLKQIDEALAQPEQEPVAWIYSQGAAKVVSMNYVAGVRANPLYTTPPQRTWVGLTDEEIKHIEETTTCLENESWLHNLTRNLEAKLKEKNT